MPDNTSELVPYTAMIPRSDLELLREIAAKARIPVSILVRQAIRDYLEVTSHDVVPWHKEHCTNRTT